MTKNSNDIIIVETEEAEERNGREAEVVQAIAFQAINSEFKSRHGYESVMKNWCEGEIKNSVRDGGDDVIIKHFNCVATANIIGTRDFKRMSVL